MWDHSTQIMVWTQQYDYYAKDFRATQPLRATQKPGKSLYYAVKKQSVDKQSVNYTPCK